LERSLYIKSILSYSLVRFLKVEISAGIEYPRYLAYQPISVIIPDEVHLTPGIPEV
jgi:hypothetical protein